MGFALVADGSNSRVPLLKRTATLGANYYINDLFISYNNGMMYIVGHK